MTIEIVEVGDGTIEIIEVSGPQGVPGVVAAAAPATFNPSTHTVGVAVGTAAGTVAAGNDARLSDQRVPVDASVTPAKLSFDVATQVELDAEVARASAAEASKADAAATTAALAGKADLSGGKVVTSQLPALAVNEVFPVANQAAMLALTAQRGDVAVRADNGHQYMLAADDATVLANWVDLGRPTADVTSVNGQAGVVVLGAADVSADAAGAATAVQAASLQRASNLSDVASAATARTNLGLGTAATQPSTAFDAAGAATAAQAAAAADPRFSSPIAGIVYPAVKFNVRLVVDAAITSGSASLTSATAAFTSADVGKKVGLWGAGASGATLTTTIATYVSATQVTLAINASTTVASGGVLFWGNDDSAVIQAAIDSLYASGGGIVQLPRGCGFASVIIKPTVIIQGVGTGRSATQAGTILQAPPDATMPVIASGSYGSNLDPYHCGIRDLTVYGGGPSTPGIQVNTQGPNVRGIELTSSAGTEVLTTAGHLGSVFIRDVNVIGMCGDAGIVLGLNQRNSWFDGLYVYRCKGTGIIVNATDCQFSGVQVGVCGTGIVVNSTNNLFSNCKAWWCGDPAQTAGGGNGWELRHGVTQLTGCQSQDNFNYGLAIIAAGNNPWSNIITGFVSGGDTNGAVLLQSNGTNSVLFNRVEVAVVSADRTAGLDNAAFVLDAGGVAGTIVENSLMLHPPNYFSGTGASYANYKLLNSALMNRNALVLSSWQGYIDDGNIASGTYNPFFGSAATRRIRLTGNITIGLPAAATASGQMPPGAVVTFVIVQDATGSRTVTWDASWVGATAPSSAANSITVEKFQNFSNTTTPVWQRI